MTEEFKFALIHMYDFIIVILCNFALSLFLLDCRKVEMLYIKMHCQCITSSCAYLIENSKVAKLALRVCPLTIRIYGIAVHKVADIHRKCRSVSILIAHSTLKTTVLIAENNLILSQFSFNLT